MKLELSFDEVRAALSYWLEKTHPTVMLGQQVELMNVTTYPNRVELTLAPIPAPEAPLGGFASGTS